MKKRIISFLLTVVMVISILPTMVYAGGASYSITDGTAPSANGSISFDKTTADEDDTITITVNPKDGYRLKSLTAVPEAPTISTIADVLATVEEFPEDTTGGTYPVTPSGAWSNGNGCFAYIYGRGNAFILSKDSSYTYGFLTTTVTKKENCYTATISYGSLTFNMENGMLTSFEFTADPSKPNAANYVGTYTPANTPSPRLKPITPAKQTDGTYQFTMPAANVTVTAEFEKVLVTIADILPDNFPTSSAGGWLNENGGKSYIMNGNLFVYGKTNVELSKSVTKKDDGNYEYQGTSGTKITFVMESGKLTKIYVSGSVYPENNGTYVAPHAHTFTYTANNGKLTATCTAGCDKGYDTTPLTLTLTAPASLVYDGNAKAFTFADGEATAWTGAGLELPTITYYQKYSGQGWYTQLNEVPVNADGDYMAEIVVNNKAAQVKFTIDKATPYIKTNPAPNDIDYGEKLEDSTLFGGYVQVSSTNTTQVGGLFEWTNPDTAPGLDDSEVTEYDVTFTPADTDNFNTVSCKVKIKVTHTHNPVKVNGQAATETASGWKDYYKCDCDALFEDENGTTPIENLDTWKAEGGNGYIPPLAPQNYTVTFNMNGHGTQIAAQTVESGSKATKPSDPTASGWTFGGWYTDATYKVTFDFGTAITTDTTIYAKWTEVPTPPESYTVTFNMGGHGTQIAAQTVESGSMATKPSDPTASGWTFGGWYTDTTYKVTFDFGTAITTDTTIYAKWTEVPTPPVSYTVTFNMGGHGTQIAAQTVESGSKATKPSDPTASGWTFDGWYTDTTYKVTFDFGTAITTDTTIYAKWTEVTYDFEDDEKLIWQLGSAETLNYVVHRSVDDSETFSLFVGIQVDDVDVSAENYDAKSGSLILNLKPSYLSTLSAGEHTLKILFKDGTISIKFEVEPIDPSPTATPKPDGSLPQTGEADSWTAIGGILLIAGAAALAIVSVRKRREI